MVFQGLSAPRLRFKMHTTIIQNPGHQSFRVLLAVLQEEKRHGSGLQGNLSDLRDQEMTHLVTSVKVF